MTKTMHHPVRTVSQQVAGCTLTVRQEGSYAQADGVLTTWVLVDDATGITVHATSERAHRNLASYQWRCAVADGTALATTLRAVVRQTLAQQADQ